jgi:predicted dehydrogenase
MAADYRIGVIGHTGQGNYGHGIDTVWLQMAECEIVAVADADEKGRADAANRLKVDSTFADYREMLDKTKPDIVAICPRWPNQHLQMVLAAAERGMHIYMEKPFCRTLEEADQIVTACQKHKIKLAIAHQTRYSPRLGVVRELIEDGKIGEILEIRGRGKEDARGGGEDLWVLGSHVLNLMNYFAGEPQWCFAQIEEAGKPVGKAQVKQGNEGLGPLAGDMVRAMYGFNDGITGYFNSVRNAAGGRFGIQIFGSKGVIELLTGFLPEAHLLEDPNWSPGRSGQQWLTISSAGLGEPEPSADAGLHGGNLLACFDLLDSIRQDRQPECNCFEGRMTVEMIAAVFESHRLQRPVDIPLTTRVNPLTLM